MNKKLKRICALVISAIFILTLVPKASAKTGKPLSPAFNVIAASNPMIVSAEGGGTITFSASDFKDALGIKKLDSIVITSLPSASAGELKLGSLTVTKGQVITASSISSLTFIPKNGTEMAEFTFTAGTSYDCTAVMYFPDERNYSPISLGIDESFFKLKTYKNIAVSGNMRCVDPEGDSVRYEVVSYPEKGLLTVKDRVSGEYTYTPMKNYMGSDSFSYVAVDKYGNRSEKITVDISVSRSGGVAVFKDMIYDSAHYGALLLDSMGILKGRKDEGENVFMPDKAISYGDFLKASMTAAKTPLKTVAPNEIGEALTSHPKEYQPYLLTAYELSLINAEGLKELDCNRELTKAEACVILDALIGAEDTTAIPVFDDIESVPSYALDSVCALYEIGVIRAENGVISPSDSLTRGDCAEMLAAILNRN